MVNGTGLWIPPSTIEGLRLDVMARGRELVPFYEAAGQRATAEHMRCTIALLAWAPEDAVRQVVGRLGQLFVTAAHMLPVASRVAS